MFQKKDLYSLFIGCLQANYVTVENYGDFSKSISGDTLTLYFEWSDGATDWKNNFAFFVKPYKDMKQTWYCHRGFLKVWKSIEPYIKEDILNEKIKNIRIIGYSHGAAIAQLCYEYVKFHRPDVLVNGVGFGAPRVFWGPASKEIKERCKDFLVVRKGKDIVTHVPPAFFGFRHLGSILTIGNKVHLIEDHYPKSYADALLEIHKAELLK